MGNFSVHKERWWEAVSILGIFWEPSTNQATTEHSLCISRLMHSKRQTYIKMCLLLVGRKKLFSVHLNPHLLWARDDLKHVPVFHVAAQGLHAHRDGTNGEGGLDIWVWMGLQGLDNINNICVAGGKKRKISSPTGATEWGKRGTLRGCVSKGGRKITRRSLWLGFLGSLPLHDSEPVPERHGVSAFPNPISTPNCARVSGRISHHFWEWREACRWPWRSDGGIGVLRPVFQSI